MKAKDQSTRESDEKLLGNYFVKKFTPIAVVFIVAHMVLFLVLDALGTSREISALVLLICGGLVGALSRRHMKREFMPLWSGRSAGAEQNLSTKEETPPH